MKNRKPFKLKYILILYNLAQVILSFYIFWEGLTVCWLWNYNWRCEPVDFSRNETAMRIARGCYGLLRQFKCFYVFIKYIVFYYSVLH